MRVSGLFQRVQTAASRPTKPKRKAEKYAEKSMRLINKRENKRKSVLQIQKSMHKEPGRAGGVSTTAAGKVCTRTKKKGQKKGKKEASAGQNLRLSRSAGFRRPECGGGVCGSGGCLVCTLFAGCITEAAGAASETGWAALYTHFLPAELAFSVRLVYALFAELCPGSMHTK